ncbi:MAG: dTDP-4-dehydrorhamnose reductase [Chloroflexota bacterium]|nr:dTDP-4-dehydrorhamnose reductase [Chloroflexota bacterium]
MRVLITGAAGMLGSAVYPAFTAAGHDVFATDLEPRDVAGMPMGRLDVRAYGDVVEAIRDARADMVLHLAAETDLETCEADPEHAYRTNTLGTHNVALVCQAADLPIVYISTAGVFDGEKADGPYDEFDTPRPINVYGRSKFEGELLVLRLVPRHFVIRAGWMVGGIDRDHKFVAKVIDQIRAGATTIRAVTDKLGTPTYTSDFAQNMLELIETPFYGRYHMACLGEGSRYDVAREIVDFYGRHDVDVVPVTSEAFADEYPAPRPRSEMMRNHMLELRGLNRMRPWREALREYLTTADFRL